MARERRPDLLLPPPKAPRVPKAKPPPPPSPTPQEVEELAAKSLLAAEDARVDQEREAKLRDVWAECCRDPVIFAWHVLGVWCWGKQREMLRMMADNNRVAIRSAQKISKTMSIVVFGLWWLHTKANAKVLVTSSTYDNIKSVFWSELKAVVRNAKVALGGRVPDDPATGIQLPDGRFLKGFSTNSQEGWGGFSGPAMLFLIDEASGIEQRMFEAMSGNLAGGGSLVTIGNPIQNDGPFFDAFHGQRAHWKTFSMSGYDSPNCTGEVVKVRRQLPNGGGAVWEDSTAGIPGLSTPEAMAQDEETYGREHPFFITRRLGDFARESDDAIVPLGLVEKARNRWMIEPGADGYVAGSGRLVLGVDPARFGTDAIAIATRRGRRVYRVQAIHGAKVRGDAGDDNPAALLTQHVVAKIKAEIEYFNRDQKPEDKPALVNIDAGGGYGSGIADLLREARWSAGKPLEHQRLCEVCEVNSADVSDNEDEHNNMRTQLLFGVREWLEQSPTAIPMAVSGPTAAEYDMLLSDLIATRYGHDTRSRKKAESKDDVKERLKRSPDRGDALALCLYMGGNSVSDFRAVAVPYQPQEAAQQVAAAAGVGGGMGRSFVVSRPNY